MNYIFCGSAPIYCKILTTFGDLGSGKTLVFLSERSLLTLHTISDKSSDFKAS